jgi:hypothetical protein
MLSALDELHPLFDHSLAFDGVRKRLRAYIINNPKEMSALRAKGQQPRLSCLSAIVKITHDDLVSGRYHIYRGVLSLTGQSKQGIFATAMNELEKAGICSAEGRRSQMRELEEGIREAG